MSEAKDGARYFLEQFATLKRQPDTWQRFFVRSLAEHFERVHDEAIEAAAVYVGKSVFSRPDGDLPKAIREELIWDKSSIPPCPASTSEGATVCLCGHEQEYHDESGCLAEIARDETCRCKKFLPVTPSEQTELAAMEKRGVKWVQGGSLGWALTLSKLLGLIHNRFNDREPFTGAWDEQRIVVTEIIREQFEAARKGATMSIMTITTRITRQYLERKTKSDLAQMYLNLLDDREKMNDAVDLAVTLLEDGAPHTALDRLKPFERPGADRPSGEGRE